MRRYYEPGDVKILKARLEKIEPESQRPIDIQAQIINMSIYEDITEPTVVVEITLADSLNLVYNYPIIGEEKLTVTFHTPGRDNPTTYSFYVYSIESVSYNASAGASYYLLKAVSPIHYSNAGYLVENSYNSLTISDIVKDILTTASNKFRLKTPLYIEETKGVYPIIIPGLTPFQSIDMLKQKAVSASSPSGSGYLFFENQFGMHFRTLENLIAENKSDVGSKSFTFEPNTDKNLSFRNILNLVHITKFDTVTKLFGGVFASAVTTFDMLKKKVEEVNFNINEHSKKLISTDNALVFPNTNKFIDLFSQNSTLNLFIPKDSSKGPDFIDDNLLTGNALLNLAQQNLVRILIYGDSYISAGDIIELTIPEASGTTEKKSKDRMYSGNYIVVRLRHNITTENGFNPKHLISMDCTRVGYNV